MEFRIKGIPNRPWTIEPEADSFTFELFAQCIADMAEAVRKINRLCLAKTATKYSFQKAARDMSVAIRKVLLDHNGRLFRNCVKPKLHTLRRPSRRLEPDVLIERIEGMSIGFTVGDSDVERTQDFPPYEHRTVVKPLYGLIRTGKEQYQLDDMFDSSRKPLKYGRWSKLEVLQVGDTVLTTERLLRLEADKEGAHVELNPMTRLNMSSPVNVSIPGDNFELYRKGIWVKFGGISYVQIFTLLLGVYLVKMMQATLLCIPEKLKNHRQIAYYSNEILKSPSHMLSPPLRLEKEFNIGQVFHSTGNPGEPLMLAGQVQKKVGNTTIQIPGWN